MTNEVGDKRSEEHTSELQSRPHLVCRLLLEKKNQQYGLTLHDLAERIEENNTNFGGGYIEHASEQYTFLGSGRATTADDFGNIVLTAKNGTPVLVRDVFFECDGAPRDLHSFPTRRSSD